MILLLLWGIFGYWDKQKNRSPFQGCVLEFLCDLAL